MSFTESTEERKCMSYVDKKLYKRDLGLISIYPPCSVKVELGERLFMP